MILRVPFSNLRRPAFGHGLSPEIRVVHNVHQRLLLNSVSEPSLVLPVLVVSVVGGGVRPHSLEKIFQ